MFYDQFFKKYIKNLWLRLNVEALVVGLIIGGVLNVFSFLISKSNNQERILVTFMVSYILTMIITNLIALSKLLIKQQFKARWAAPGIYYSTLILGAIIGTELVFFVLSLFFQYDYKLFTHTGDLKFNLFISLVVGTIVYINGLQKDHYDYLMKEKELQVLKLAELKTTAELQSLQSRINPHFLYNSLNSIASLIYEDAEKAEEMTIKLSKLFRHSINVKDELFSSIASEIELVKLYLDIEKIRFGDRLQVKIHVDEHLQSFRIPRFLIQPLIENAMKHGLSRMKEQGQIHLHISDIQHALLITVHDNGPDFPKDLTIGYGIQSIYDKLNIVYPNEYEITLSNGVEKAFQIQIPKQTI